VGEEPTQVVVGPQGLSRMGLQQSGHRPSSGGPDQVRIGCSSGALPRRVLPCPSSLPRSSDGSASTTSLSRPAQASHALRPAACSPTIRGFIARLRPRRFPGSVARKLPRRESIRETVNDTDAAPVPVGAGRWGRQLGADGVLHRVL